MASCRRRPCHRQHRAPPLAAYVAGMHESVPHVAGRLGYVTTQEYLTAHQEVKTPLQTASAQVNRLAPKFPHQNWDGPVLPPQTGLQRKFTRAMQDSDRANFFHNATDTDPRQATRVRACGGPGAGAWLLHEIASEDFGLCLRRRLGVTWASNPWAACPTNLRPQTSPHHGHVRDHVPQGRRCHEET